MYVSRSQAFHQINDFNIKKIWQNFLLVLLHVLLFR